MNKLPNVGSDASRGVQTWTGTIIGPSIYWKKSPLPAMEEGLAQFEVKVYLASLKEGSARLTEAGIRRKLDEITALAIEGLLRGRWDDLKQDMITAITTSNAEVANAG